MIRRDGASEDSAIVDGGSARRDGGPRFPSSDVQVTLPFGAPEQTLAIEVEASLGLLDVHFSIDTTGSFGEEIDALQADLEGRILPTLRTRVEDVAVGVSRFEDFPVAPHGGEADRPFALLSPVTTTVGRAGAAVAALDQPLGNGGDTPESGGEALYQIATGEGFTLAGRSIVPRFDGIGAPGGGTVGGVGFRAGALHAVVHVTDAPAHDPRDYADRVPGSRSTAEAATALRAIGAHVLGIASGSPARPHLERLALDTGAVVAADAGGACPTGIDGATHPATAGRCPLVFDVARDGSGLSDAIVDALVGLVGAVRFDEAFGVTEDDRLGFVRAIEADDASSTDGAPLPTRADTRPPGDGFDDTFLDVAGGVTLRFVVHLQNTTLAPADYDQVFRIAVEIRGDELTLARRTIRVTVPRAPRATMMDAGLDAGLGDASDATTDGGGDGG